MSDWLKLICLIASGGQRHTEAIAMYVFFFPGDNCPGLEQGEGLYGKVFRNWKNSRTLFYYVWSKFDINVVHVFCINVLKINETGLSIGQKFY